MLALVLAVLLTVPPGPSSAERDACADLLPVKTRSELAIGGLSEARQVWTSEPPVSRDSLRASLKQFKEARDCFRSTPPANDTSGTTHLIRASYWAGIVHVALREFPEAFQSLQFALRTVKKGKNSLREEAYTEFRSDLHRSLGYLHFLLGDLSASIQQYVRAYRATPEDDVEGRVESLLGVGTLHLRTEDRSSAQHYFNRAEQLVETGDLEPDDRRELRSRTYHVQADLLVGTMSTPDFSYQNLRRARTLARNALQFARPDTEEHARISILLSESLGYLGKHDEALRLNARARRYAQSVSDTRLLTLARMKEGAIRLQAEQWSRADSALIDALRRADAMDALDYQRRILHTLGRLHEMQGRWTDADRYYRKGAAVVEKHRESLTASQWSMTAFAQWRDVYRGRVRSLLAQEKDREALRVLDQSRARHLQDLRTRARISNELPAHERARLDSLSRALVDVRNQLGDDTLSETDEGALRDREASLMAARQQLLQIDSSPSRASLTGISEVLADQNRVLVSYFLDDPWPVYDRAPRSVAFVMTGDTLQTVPLPNLTQDSVQATVASVSPLFTSEEAPGTANGMHFDLRPLHRLYESLYTPVRARVPGDRSLTVVPDGPLFHLPFSMLVDSMPGGRFAPDKARFLLHERPTSLELASSLVADAASTTYDWSEFAPQMAAYGVSRFDTLKTVPSGLRSAVPSALSGPSLGLPPLPGVEEEIRSLKARFPGARVAMNDEATEADFCRSLRTAGIVHIASHAFVNATAPLQNAILLRGERRTPRYLASAASPESESDSPTETDAVGRERSDGLLFLHELQGERARLPMVVLSGCSTARGTLRGGEGMEGLQYAFRAMGAQSTVSTLWPVADDASVQLMDTFYAHLQNGAAKDEALRRARLHILRSRADWASPFFWAPPVLYGSPSPLPLEPSQGFSLAWWLIGGTVAALVVFVLAWKRRTLFSGRTAS